MILNQKELARALRCFSIRAIERETGVNYHTVWRLVREQSDDISGSILEVLTDFVRKQSQELSDALETPHGRSDENSNRSVATKAGAT